MLVAHPELPWRSKETHGWNMLGGCNMVQSEFLYVFDMSSLATLSL